MKPIPIPQLPTLRNIPWPFVGGVIIPLSIGLLGPSLFSSLRVVVLAFICLYPFVVLVKIFASRVEKSENIITSIFRFTSLMPAGTVYNAEMSKPLAPLVTVSLIFVNSFLFLVLPVETTGKYIFYPVGDPSYFQIAIAFWVNAFLHADTSHLFWNMIFLWVFGSVVEARVGHKHFIIYYLFFIVASNFLTILSLFVSSLWGDETFYHLFVNSHGLGASGAISGVMGLFAIRCYFSKVTIAVPCLLCPILTFPFRLQGVVLVGLFFALDVSGSLYPTGTGDVDYWAHVGGYLAGVYIAWQFGLHKTAKEEAVKYRATELSKECTNRLQTTKSYTAILEKEPDNVEALEHLLSVNRYNDEKSGYYYKLLLEVLFIEDFPRAITLFRDHYPSHLKVLSPKILLKLGKYFFEKDEQVKVMTCLEFASLEPGPWQAKALTLLAESYVAIDNIAMACKTWEDIREKFPETSFSKEAEWKYQNHIESKQVNHS